MVSSILSLLVIFPFTNAIHHPRSILVVGSLNADTFLPVSRFPSPGENLTLLPECSCEHLVDVPGGKGMNQAIAVCKLSNRKATQSKTSFLGQFGNDAAAHILRSSLIDNGVDISLCGQSHQHPSGRGYVMITKTGEVSAVISGGSNQNGWQHFGVGDHAEHGNEVLSDQEIQDIVRPYSLVQLQCEIPNLVNLRLARAAKRLGITVIFDVGGEDREMSRELLDCVDFVVPNETELARLSSCFTDEEINDNDKNADIERIQSQLGPDVDALLIFKRVSLLQKNGGMNVLVTLGSKGSILFRKKARANRDNAASCEIIYEPACCIPSGSSVVDETGAGDCYRAAFSVSLMEKCIGSDDDIDEYNLRECMKFAR